MTPPTPDDLARAMRAMGQAGVSAQQLAESLRGLGQAFQAAHRAEPGASALPGHLCEQCLDAPAVRLVPAPWGGEMGVCEACMLASLRHLEAQALYMHGLLEQPDGGHTPLRETMPC